MTEQKDLNIEELREQIVSLTSQLETVKSALNEANKQSMAKDERINKLVETNGKLYQKVTGKAEDAETPKELTKEEKMNKIIEEIKNHVKKEV